MQRREDHAALRPLVPGLDQGDRCATAVGESARTVVFIHIPKTAGMTLKSVVGRQHRPGEFALLYEERIRQSIDAFLAVPEGERARYRFVLGHVGYGLHEFLPQKVTYATFLRDPIERIVSYFYYVLRRPDHFLHDTARKLGLKDFARSDATAKLANGQTKYLAALDAQDATAATLECVKRHVAERFAVVGLTEQFDASLLLLRRVARWGIPWYDRENVTRDRPRLSEIPHDALEAIVEHNRLDLELYSWARERFARERNAAGLWLETELAALHAGNTLRAACHRFPGLHSSRA
jgi:hypothetical protein